MGHLVNPISFRLGTTQTWKFQWFKLGSRTDYINNLKEDLTGSKYIENFYKYVKLLKKVDKTDYERQLKEAFYLRPSQVRKFKAKNRIFSQFLRTVSLIFSHVNITRFQNNISFYIHYYDASLILQHTEYSLTEYYIDTFTKKRDKSLISIYKFFDFFSSFFNFKFKKFSRFVGFKLKKIIYKQNKFSNINDSFINNYRSNSKIFHINKYNNKKYRNKRDYNVNYYNNNLNNNYRHLNKNKSFLFNNEAQLQFRFKTIKKINADLIKVKEKRNKVWQLLLRKILSQLIIVRKRKNIIKYNNFKLIIKQLKFLFLLLYCKKLTRLCFVFVLRCIIYSLVNLLYSLSIYIKKNMGYLFNKIIIHFKNHFIRVYNRNIKFYTKTINFLSDMKLFYFRFYKKFKSFLLLKYRYIYNFIVKLIMNYSIELVSNHSFIKSSYAYSRYNMCLIFSRMFYKDFKVLNISNYSNYFIKFCYMENRNVTSSFLCNYFVKKLSQKYSVFEMVNPVMKDLRSNSWLDGFKISFAGRMTKRQRAGLIVRRHGNVPLSTLSSFVDYATGIVILRHGICCVKVWLHKNAGYKPFTHIFSYKYV